VEFRFNQSRRNCIDPNAFGCHLRSEADRQRVNRALAGSIMNPLTGTAQLRGDGRDIDDVSTAAAMLGRLNRGSATLVKLGEPGARVPRARRANVSGATVSTNT
jgi:hypothetical protein